MNKLLINCRVPGGLENIIATLHIYDNSILNCNVKVMYRNSTNTSNGCHLSRNIPKDPTEFEYSKYSIQYSYMSTNAKDYSCQHILSRFVFIGNAEKRLTLADIILMLA